MDPTPGVNSTASGSSSPTGKRRRLPFFQVTKDAMRTIRVQVDPKRRCDAISLFTTLAELANDQRGDVVENVSRKVIAELAGFSPDTLDRAAKELAKIGLLAVEIGRQYGQANRWVLLSPESEGAAASGKGVPLGAAIRARVIPP
jgi:hypothetical protein